MKLQAEVLSIKQRINLAEAVEYSGKEPAANHLQNMKYREDVRSLDIRINIY